MQRPALLLWQQQEHIGLRLFEGLTSDYSLDYTFIFNKDYNPPLNSNLTAFYLNRMNLVK